MKLFLATALLGFLPLALAAKSLKSVVVTFPKNTPDSVISKAKDSLVASVYAASNLRRVWLLILTLRRVASSLMNTVSSASTPEDT